MACRIARALLAPQDDGVDLRFVRSRVWAVSVLCPGMHAPLVAYGRLGWGRVLRSSGLWGLEAGGLVMDRLERNPEKGISGIDDLYKRWFKKFENE